MRVHRGDRRLVVVDGVTVAKKDHVLDGGRRVRQRLVSRIQVGCVTGRIAQAHRLDLFLDGGLVGQGSQRDDDGAHVAAGDPHQVARRELVDDRLRRAAQHLVALHALGRLQREHDGDRWLLHVLGQLDLHRQRRLERGAGIAPRAVAVGTADDHQPGAEVTD